MSKGTIILLIILAIVIVALGLLYYFGNRMQKKQEAQQEQLAAAAQQVSLLVIDKKKMKLKDAGFPQIIVVGVLTYGADALPAYRECCGQRRHPLVRGGCTRR